MRNGFTLIDILIGAMIGAIVLMGVYIAFNATTKYWTKSSSVASSAQTARYVNQHMAYHLKVAENDAINTYLITTDLTNKYQRLQYNDSKLSADTSHPYYYYYFFPNYTTDTTRAGKIYWGNGATPADSANQPLTGDNIVNADTVYLFSSSLTNGRVNANANVGIFSTDGSNYAQTAPAISNIVYIDFIAQDYSALSRAQTATGNAQPVEIRTAATYPHC